MEPEHLPRFSLPLLLFAITLAGCMPGTPLPRSAEGSPLTGSWSLVQIQSMDDVTYEPSDSEAFTLKFDPGGRVSARIDCNRGQGEWKSESPNELRIESMATTRAMCAPDSLHDRFLSDLAHVRSYLFRDGHLYLSTMADGSILEFRPSVQSPSFDCAAATGDVQATICRDIELARLDHKLDAVYHHALATSSPSESSTLKAMQRGWIKGRDDCWKADDVRRCVRDEYETRITDLQISSAIVSVPRPFVFACTDDEQLDAYFYNDTARPALVLRNDSSRWLLFLARSASGARYLGQNVQFWNKGKDAVFSRYGENDLHCHVIKRPGTGDVQ
ncbi:MAG: META domain-containing protein [Pseudomonadales bacterium]|nr:META domain-containing protein [Pseudomonadales bacterium]